MLSRIRRTRRRFVWFLAAYTLTAVTTLAVLRSPAKNEIFPVFSWVLFVITPADGAEYGLRLLAADGPEYFEQTTGRHRYANSIDAYMTTQTLGTSIEKDRPKKLETSLRQLRGVYLADVAEGTEVQVVRRRFDPIVRYGAGTFEEEFVVGTFVIGSDEGVVRERGE